MEEELKKAAELTPASEVPPAESKPETAKAADDTIKPKNNETDYKTELEKEQAKQLKQAEFTIEQLRKKKEDDKDKEDENPPHYPAEMRKIASEEAERATKGITDTLLNSTITSELDSITDNADEKKLIDFHYKNSIVRSGTTPENIREDLENARLLANKKKIHKDMAELNHALRSERTKSKGGYASAQYIDEGTELVPTDADKLLMGHFGINAQDVKPE